LGKHDGSLGSVMHSGEPRGKRVPRFLLEQ